MSNPFYGRRTVEKHGPASVGCAVLLPISKPAKDAQTFAALLPEVTRFGEKHRMHFSPLSV